MKSYSNQMYDAWPQKVLALPEITKGCSNRGEVGVEQLETPFVDEEPLRPQAHALKVAGAVKVVLREPHFRCCIGEFTVTLEKWRG